MSTQAETQRPAVRADKEDTEENPRYNFTGLSWRSTLGQAYAGKLSPDDLEKMRKEALSILRAYHHGIMSPKDEAYHVVKFTLGVMDGHLNSAYTAIDRIHQFTDRR